MRVLGDWVNELLTEDRLSEGGKLALEDALRSPDQVVRDRASELLIQMLPKARPTARGGVIHLLQSAWWPPAVGLSQPAFDVTLPAVVEADAGDDELILDTMLLWSHLARVNAGLLASLVDTLGHASPGARRAAAGALSRMGAGAKAQVPELVKLLEDPDPQVSEAALEALGVLGPVNVEPALTAFRRELQTQQGKRRFLALSALRGILEHARIVGMALPADTDVDEQALINALTDPEVATRMQAAGVLGLRGQTSDRVEEALVRVLSDASADVAAAAAVALLRVKRAESQALELLGAQLLSAEVGLQDSAIYALEPLEPATLARARPALDAAAISGVGNGREAAKGLLLRLRV
ncbi:MAG: HEAT repeat domain-containing protein [Myxococcota bacterium]|nr:HEAT repeat domain-containing protein [Myxococcota bacterium]